MYEKPRSRPEPIWDKVVGAKTSGEAEGREKSCGIGGGARGGGGTGTDITQFMNACMHEHTPAHQAARFRRHRRCGTPCGRTLQIGLAIHLNSLSWWLPPRDPYRAPPPPRRLKDLPHDSRHLCSWNRQHQPRESPRRPRWQRDRCCQCSQHRPLQGLRWKQHRRACWSGRAAVALPQKWAVFVLQGMGVDGAMGLGVQHVSGWAWGPGSLMDGMEGWVLMNAHMRPSHFAP